jgi:hypothetical protein
MTCNGGAHKNITGTLTFFNQDVQKNAGALNFHANLKNNMNVYPVLSGNVTPAQKIIVNNHCLVDVQKFNSIYNWPRQNNPHYSDLAEIESCPNPIIFGDDVVTEEALNPEVEKQLDFQYWFSSVGEPANTISPFSKSEFIDVLLKAKEPTMIFCSSNYQPDYKLTLPSVFPLHSLFGADGIEEFRRTKVSVEKCFKHYLKISCPQFKKSDITLVIGHLFFWKKF